MVGWACFLLFCCVFFLVCSCLPRRGRREQQSFVLCVALFFAGSCAGRTRNRWGVWFFSFFFLVLVWGAGGAVVWDSFSWLAVWNFPATNSGPMSTVSAFEAPRTRTHSERHLSGSSRHTWYLLARSTRLADHLCPCCHERQLDRLGPLLGENLDRRLPRPRCRKRRRAARLYPIVFWSHSLMALSKALKVELCPSQVNEWRGTWMKRW